MTLRRGPNPPMPDEAVLIEEGLRHPHRVVAALGYWEAFAAKLRIPLGPPERAIGFIEANLDAAHAISAVSADGRFLGVAGFKTPEGAFLGGGMRELRASYGTVGSVWRSGLLAILERECEPGTLLMDGIFVHRSARGLGIGSRLLAAIEDRARSKGFERIRLDVIDENTRARALYERRGFQPVSHSAMGPLHRIFGFSGATTMIKELSS